VILVTGGLGYIGSHTCVALAQAGFGLAIVDNLCNSKSSVLQRIRELAPGATITFHQLDLRDRKALGAAFALQPIDAVVHFAGLKAVGESVAKPLLYWDNNVGGTIALLEVMREQGVRRIVFSSSATIYGPPEYLPYREEHPLRPESPYGRTKLAIEQLLADESGSDPNFHFASLRYFNPIGAHPSGRIGEDPRGEPNNLVPYITQVAIGRLPKLRIYGDDYATADGTGVRDYIHVMDLAEGHAAALRYLSERERSITANLGTGSGCSVLQMVAAFERITGKSIPYEYVDRRPGDIAAFWADPALAARELGWRATLGLDDMCRDAWRWQSQNPAGYP
jgi:UDP-glucose 4-epimerase